jgi:hypothetical protein
LLCILTFGIYSLWVVPRIQEWKAEHTDFDPTWRPNTLGGPPVAAVIQAQPTPQSITIAQPQQR